jgi:hypothetical protein
MYYIKYCSIAIILTVSISTYPAEALTLAQLCARDNLHKQALQRLASGDITGINDRDEQGMTPLLWTVRFCLELNQSVDFPISKEKKDNISNTGEELFFHLVSNGADQRAKDVYGQDLLAHLGQAFRVKPMIKRTH